MAGDKTEVRCRKREGFGGKWRAGLFWPSLVWKEVPPGTCMSALFDDPDLEVREPKASEPEARKGKGKYHESK